MNLDQAYELLWKRSQPMLEFKRRSLSMLEGQSPVLELGPVNVTAFTKTVKTRDVMSEFPGKSRGFVNMSEIWMVGDFAREQRKPIEVMAQPILSVVRAVTTKLLGKPTKVFKSVVDTIDENSCIIPHSDDYFHHSLSLRIHAPLFTSPGSIGISWHPETLVHQCWRMPEVGKLYAFNNFEPHTVIKTDVGQRAHLICDVVLADLFADFGPTDGEIIRAALMSQGPGASPTFNPNLITHNTGNLTMRNRLAAQHGQMEPVNSLHEQTTEEYVQRTLTWLKNLAMPA